MPINILVENYYFTLGQFKVTITHITKLFLPHCKIVIKVISLLTNRIYKGNLNLYKR